MTEETDDTDDGRIVVVDGETRIEDALAVRRTVFIEEQAVPEDLELDAYDDAPDTTHLVAYDGDRPVGTARLRPYDGETHEERRDGDDGDGEHQTGTVGKVQRVAVVADRRGEGWGRRLVTCIEHVARERGFDRLTLDVQTHAREFYEGLDYEVVSEDEFLDAGIPHVEMEKRL
ncbi:GNAT family N-acetyltransferase [Halomarina rubra]|uniref:GNAT family N-acetyltransferase n=1 Tax=Halomarina rubra TaxID=2071873 RepID=A0ABD6B1N7_9EURY|nr:GNAT family N-acetyltransferase [Halomarina rubra]